MLGCLTPKHGSLCLFQFPKVFGLWLHVHGVGQSNTFCPFFLTATPKIHQKTFTFISRSNMFLQNLNRKNANKIKTMKNVSSLDQTAQQFCQHFHQTAQQFGQTAQQFGQQFHQTAQQFGQTAEQFGKIFSSFTKLLSSLVKLLKL